MDEEKRTRDFLLSVAEEVIQARAARDDCEPGAYDTKHDQEGYVTSILTALRTWCDEHSVDWNDELNRVQDFFLQDLGVPDTPALLEEMACPACGHAGSFYIQVREVLLMFASGDVLPGDQGETWDDDCYCSCRQCCHAGRVYEFRTDLNRTRQDSSTAT